MRKILFYLSPIVLAIGIFFIVISVFYSKDKGVGALQITSVPKSKVYLDGKYMGETPFCKCDSGNLLVARNYSLKLIPVENGFEVFNYTISVNPSVLTAVDRTFGPIGKSYGSIISLEKNGHSNLAQIFIASFPYGAKIKLDGNNVGATPLMLDATSSDHDLLVSKQGYKNKDLKVHSVNGYKLEAIVFLPIEEVSSLSALISPVASPSPILQQVKILNTPTGFLRVRNSPSFGGSQIGEINPGEFFPLISEQNGWFEIKLKNNKTGWISSSYALKQ